jgi:glycosyltransferase involved in cell wall biosynthesis
VRVLHIYKDYYPPTCGGIEIAINRIIEGTRDCCDEIAVLICNRSYKTEFAEVEGTPVYKVGEWGRFLSAPLAPGFPRWIRRCDADILHYHIPNPTAVISHLLVRPKGKLVVHYHSDIVRQKRWLAVYEPFRHAFMRQAEKVIVTSPNYLESSEFLQPYRQKCAIVPFGVSLTKFARSPEVESMAETLRRRYGSRIVLYAGILRYYKGVEYLIRAMEHVDGKLLIVGDGPLLAELVSYTQTLSHADRIVFLGQVESVIPYYYAADVFCLPSIFRSEAFGLVLVEAAACGLPLISTELGTGTTYANQHGETGLVVPPMNEQAMADAINRLLNDIPLRRQYGQAAYQRISSMFTHEQMCSRILDIYREVMGK